LSPSWAYTIAPGSAASRAGSTSAFPSDRLTTLRALSARAGSVRLAGAIAQVVWSALRGSRPVGESIDAPRMHVDGSTVHLEGGWAEDATLRLGDGWEVVRWDGLNLFFGGVQAVARSADGTLSAAGDPRRGGAGVVVP